MGRIQRQRRNPLMVYLVVVISIVKLLLSNYASGISLEFETKIPVTDGNANYREGERLFELQRYDEAAMHYWRAVLMHPSAKSNTKSSSSSYSVEQVFGKFMSCFSIQDKPEDGFVYIAQESIGRGQYEMGKMYLRQALAIDPNHPDGVLLQEQLRVMGQELDDDHGAAGAKKKPPTRRRERTSSRDDDDDYVIVDDDDDDEDEDEDSDELYQDKTPEQLYEIASKYFQERDYENCADVFEISCHRSNHRLGPSCANAVYCRTMILDWGFNGTQFDLDMQRISRLSQLEASQYRTTNNNDDTDEENQDENKNFRWTRSMSTHPHMMLGYPVNSTLKRYVAEAAAFMEDISQRVTSSGQIQPLPSDLPFDPAQRHASHVQLFSSANDKKKPPIKIGFVASAFNSKAVLYLSHDMFRFFDESRFQVHIFSLGPPDNPLFIQHGMRGVDWRERVKANVYKFHDAQRFQQDHIGLARYIYKHDIHILLEWDGYARQGERAQGLFTLRPAPIQMWHQEFLGTSGAQYVDYLFTDVVTSPPKWQHLYVEKLIYLPHHFFSKGHAVQAEVAQPSLEYPTQSPASKNTRSNYKPGTGRPETNRCLAPKGVGPARPSMVFCNYNKFLKHNPETVRSWIRILRAVPNSMLCLLENPKSGVVYFRKFIHETAATLDEKDNGLSFGDGDELNRRIHFLPWQKNPFDHQRRNQDFCHVMLDSHPYNGHTTAQDALYGGVPIVTRSDGYDMSSRVTTSANVVLGLDQWLNAQRGPRHYEKLAIALGNNKTHFNMIRTKLIESALQQDPMHPYWDVHRYVKNFETGLQEAWDLYLEGKGPQHIFVKESDEAKRGTYQQTLLDNPPEGKKKQGSSDKTKKKKEEGKHNSATDEL